MYIYYKNNIYKYSNIVFKESLIIDQVNYVLINEID